MWQSWVFVSRISHFAFRISLLGLAATHQRPGSEQKSMVAMIYTAIAATICDEVAINHTASSVEASTHLKYQHARSIDATQLSTRTNDLPATLQRNDPPSSFKMGDQATTDAGYDFQLYRYTPSLPAAIVSVVVFAVLTGSHIWRLWRARAYYFTPFVIGGACT